MAGEKWKKMLNSAFNQVGVEVEAELGTAQSQLVFFMQINPSRVAIQDTISSYSWDQ